MSAPAAGRPRRLQLSLVSPWAPGAEPSGRGGLLSPHERVRTLLAILVSYPEVRYVLPDRISLEAATEPRVLETLQRFLERQQWLVRSVTVA